MDEARQAITFVIAIGCAAFAFINAIMLTVNSKEAFLNPFGSLAVFAIGILLMWNWAADIDRR